jgi:predicted MFS family arabinose efflux permease
MLSVPALAFAKTWPEAAILIITERIGKAIRNPPRDVMLSHAAKTVGYGWGFGVHEALDQTGALFGPLLVAGMLSMHHEYRRAFAVLLIPAVLTLCFLVVARLRYPKPEDLESQAPPKVQVKGFPHVFWLYMAGAAFVAAGFADFSLIAFHFQKTAVVPQLWIPVFYSIAMGISGLGSLICGRLFDRRGIAVLIPLTLLTSLFAPLAFLGGFWIALLGVALWGLGMGVHESIIPAAVATMIPAQKRPSGYGIFTAGYGVFWFAGSAIIGALYQFSMPALIAFCMAAELIAVPIFIRVRQQNASGKVAQ